MVDFTYLSEPVERPNKRIVVCCDGTWNEPEAASEDPKDKCEPTNVLKFVRAVSPRAANGVAQVTYYDAGVGTAWGVDRLVGGGFGTGISLNVVEAYRFIANNYVEGDHLFLLGFSRGAYTVRALAGLIGAVGLLPKKFMGFAADAYELYRLPKAERIMTAKWREHEALEPLPAARVPFEFIGVWDTVGALGAPTPIIGGWTRKLVGFFDTQLGDHVRNAYHALAIDERRRPFQPDLWSKAGANTTNLQQVWFAGVHTNIGSGYKNTGLSSLTLNWMMHRALRHRLEFLPFAVEAILGLDTNQLRERATTGVLMDSFSLGYQALRLLNVPPYTREIGPRQGGGIRPPDTAMPGEMIHRSALDRLGQPAPFGEDGAVAEYRPENLALAKNDLPVFEYDAPYPPR